MKRLAISILAIIVIVAVGGGLVYFEYVLKPAKIEEALAARSGGATTVAAEPAKLEQWVPQLPAIGSIVASQQIQIAAQQNGLVTDIKFDSGQDVKAGKLLVEIDTSLEKADLASNEATLRDKQRDLQRSAELVQRGNVSKSSYDASLAARDVAAANVARTKTVIEQKQVKAPFSGRLGIRAIDLGEYLAVGTQIVSLQMLDPVYVDFDVPERNIGRLKPGQPVNIVVDAFPNTPFSGKIATLDARVDRNTRNVTVRAEIPNTQKSLLPGMFASVTVAVGAAQPVVTVPRTAISFSLQGNSIYVVVPANEKARDGSPAAGGADKAKLTLDERIVTLGETRGDRTALLDGVKAGEQVVTQGQVKLRKGMAVTIDENAGLKLPSSLPKQ